MTSWTISGRDTLASSPHSMLRLRNGASSRSIPARGMFSGRQMRRALCSVNWNTCRMLHRKAWAEQSSMYATAQMSIMKLPMASSTIIISSINVSGCTRKMPMPSRVR